MVVTRIMAHAERCGLASTLAAHARRLPDTDSELISTPTANAGRGSDGRRRERGHPERQRRAAIRGGRRAELPVAAGGRVCRRWPWPDANTAIATFAAAEPGDQP